VKLSLQTADYLKSFDPTAVMLWDKCLWITLPLNVRRTRRRVWKFSGLCTAVRDVTSSYLVQWYLPLGVYVVTWQKRS